MVQQRGENMSPTREDPNLNFKVSQAELEALNAFYAAYAPRCSKGDVCRIAIMHLVRAHGFPFPDIKLDYMGTDYPLERKNNADPLPKTKKK
jgi:hypothetical protein